MEFGKLVIVAIASLLASCSGVEDSGEAPQSSSGGRCAIYAKANADCEIPLTALLANPEQYVGRSVAFVGFLAGHGYPGQVFVSREAWRMRDFASSVVLAANLDDLRKGKTGSDIKHSYVMVAGTVSRIDRTHQPNIVVTPTRLIAERRPEDFTQQEMDLIAEESGSR